MKELSLKYKHFKNQIICKLLAVDEEVYCRLLDTISGGTFHMPFITALQLINNPIRAMIL